MVLFLCTSVSFHGEYQRLCFESYFDQRMMQEDEESQQCQQCYWERQCVVVKMAGKMNTTYHINVAMD